MVCMGARGAKCLPRETLHLGRAKLRTLIVRGGLVWPGCGRGGWVWCPSRAKCLMLSLAARERDFQDRCFLSTRWKSVAIWLSAKISLIRAVRWLHSTLQTNFLEPRRESIRACDIAFRRTLSSFRSYTWCVVRWIPSC
ncbi:hypothetical protein K525DRAFT_285814 [Schizophyllum commune Loenen D]|nr:hypothetical protein K525DRAFT_285814 [Schizophyllum commune Loenen D]